MPKATTDLDNLATTRENYVGSTGKVLHMEPVSVPHFVEHPSNTKLGGGVLARYRRHVAVTCRAYIVEVRAFWYPG
jgi:hypothetical protein